MQRGWRWHFVDATTALFGYRLRTIAKLLFCSIRLWKRLYGVFSDKFWTCLINQDLEESDIISNAPIIPTIIDNLLLPNQQFYEMCSQLNESRQDLFWKEWWVATQTILNICKWRCWLWRRCFNINNCNDGIVNNNSEISKPERWSTICSSGCIFWKRCHRFQWYYIVICFSTFCSFRIEILLG